MSAVQSSIGHAELLAVMDYDPDTGLFQRKKCRPGVVTLKDREGYTIVWIKGQRYRAGRLAWFYVHGLWPSYEIDHINRIRSDNRISNLRDVDRVTNACNRGASRCGYVYYRKDRNNWSVWIKGRYVGTYLTVEQAQQARDKYLLSHGLTMMPEEHRSNGKGVHVHA